MKREEYLEILTEQIRCKKARGPVSWEIDAHMEDQKQTFLEAGMEEAKAEEMAVKEMGDPVETGISMDRIHRPKMAWGGIVLICLLSIGGLLIQYLLQKQFPDIIFLPGNLIKHWIYLAAGLAVMMLFCFMDYSRIGYKARELSIILFIFFFEGIGMFGREISGVKAWISLGGVTFDVRIAVFLFVPLYGAILFCYKGCGYKVIRKAILWMLPPIVLAFWCASPVTVFLLFLTFAVTFSIAVFKNWFQISRKIVLITLWVLIAALPFLCYAAVLLYGAAYQKVRWKMMFGLGENTRNGVVRVLLGKCHLLGANAEILNKMPGYGSDYVLTYIAGYYGIIAAVVAAGSIAFLFLYFLKISFRQKNQLGQLMGADVAWLLCFRQAFIF